MSVEFDNAISYVTHRIKRTLSFLPYDIKHRCEEIRLREGLPVCLTVDGGVRFVCSNSAVSEQMVQNCLVATCDDLKQTLSLLCNNSVYLHESEIKQGFISLKNGCRAGVCGVFNADGMLISVTSVNIRIARQIFGCATPLLPYANGGMLIAGPPGSGKTTILRDLIRQLSSGKNGRFYRVAVIDSRGELSGGAGVNDLGINTDVLYTRNKAVGTCIALRTMFPNFIAFDEIGSTEELDSVRDCFNAGVGIITTAHCNRVQDIMQRNITRNIIKSGAISCVAILSERIGERPRIFNVKEFYTNAVD